MDDSTHDVIAAFCLLIIFDLWRPYVMLFMLSWLFVAVLRTAAFLRLLGLAFPTP